MFIANKLKFIWVRGAFNPQTCKLDLENDKFYPCDVRDRCTIFRLIQYLYVWVCYVCTLDIRLDNLIQTLKLKKHKHHQI